MLTIFNRKSIYVGTNQQTFNEIRKYLEKNSIRYKYKIRNHIGQRADLKRGTIRGTLGSIGNCMDLMYEYEIWVAKSDYSKINL